MTRRALSVEERGLLDFLLTKNFPGRDRLADQTKEAEWAGSSCGCGCPSFDISVDRSLPPAEVTKGQGPVSDAVGTDPSCGGLPRPEDLRLCDWVEVAPDSYRLRWEL